MTSIHPRRLRSEPTIRVVVVEDDADDRELLIRQLRKKHVEEEVRFFADGRAALEFFNDHENSTSFRDLIAVFLDLKLPGIGGVKLLRELRRMPRHVHTPVFIMTGSINPKDFEDCRDLQVNAFLPKPMTFEVFSQAISRLPKIPTFMGEKTDIFSQLRPD